jgi:hypothetical protein
MNKDINIQVIKSTSKLENLTKFVETKAAIKSALHQTLNLKLITVALHHRQCLLLT